MLLFVLTATTTIAQSEQKISASRDADADRIEKLGGSYGLLLISKHNKLTVSITNATKKYDVISSPKANAEGMYEHQVIVDAQDNHEVKVEVHQTGDLYRTKFVATLKPDFLVAYRIEEVAMPIRMADDTRSNDAHLNADEAMLEFRTKINDLKVKCPLALGATVTQTVDPSDKSINVTTVVFPVAGLMQARNNYNETQARYDHLIDIINNGQATDADFNDFDLMEGRLKEAQQALNEISSLIVYSDSTNNLSVDITNMAPRSKRCYLVLPLETKTKVFTKEFQGHLDNGMDCLNRRKYADARTFYTNALNSKDCDTDVKPAIMQNIALCDSCIQYEKLAGASISQFLKLRDSGNATQQQASKYASAAIEFLTILNNYNPDEFYTSRIKKLSDVLNNMPLTISFTTVEWLTIEEGSPIPGVEVWAYFGDGDTAPAYVASERLFKEALKNSPVSYKHIGVSDNNGHIVIELDRSSLPAGFIFHPTIKANGFKFNPCYLDMKEFMRGAKGTYLQKQYRMKLYNTSHKHKHL